MESSIPRDLAHDAREVRGAYSLLRQIETSQLPWAIVTSCTRGLLLGWVAKFDFPRPPQTVAAEDVAAGKPDPACYVLARERIGKGIERDIRGDSGRDCEKAPLLVVEDSPTGVRAGKAAGCAVLGVSTNVSAEVLTDAGADWVVPHFEGIRLVRCEDEVAGGEEGEGSEGGEEGEGEGGDQEREGHGGHDGREGQRRWRFKLKGPREEGAGA